MNILVVGLGLIGGSFCKALSSRTENGIFGYDINEKPIEMAVRDRAIKKALAPEEFEKADLVLICLPPKIAMDFFEENAQRFKKGTIIADVCGVKNMVSKTMETAALKNGLRYVGTHPMAGREFGGYKYALENLYDNRSFIVTPTENTDKEALETVKDLARAVGFKKIVESTPAAHDRTIAYTSQLAHVVSSAYVKSPSIQKESGFTAGSFQDMTRIATLNENMWTDLFMQNREALLYELDTLIENLGKYRSALSESDAQTMTELLREGRMIKEKDLSEYSK